MRHAPRRHFLKTQWNKQGGEGGGEGGGVEDSVTWHVHAEFKVVFRHIVKCNVSWKVSAFSLVKGRITLSPNHVLVLTRSWLSEKHEDWRSEETRRSNSATALAAFRIASSARTAAAHTHRHEYSSRSISYLTFHSYACCYHENVLLIQTLLHGFSDVDLVLHSFGTDSVNI